MKPYIANLINGVVLVALGLWGYTEGSSATALIPVVFGIIFLASTSMLRKENKIVAHVVVLLTLLILGALAGMVLPARITDGNTTAVIRVSIMIFTSLIAMIFFVKSFIDARKARQS